MSLQELLDRVKVATGPDREIDGRLWCAFTPNRKFIGMAKSGQTRGDFEPGGFNPASGMTPGMVFERTDFKGTREDIQKHGGRIQQFTSSPAYTSSIDAALALVERKLPGWTVANMSQQDDKNWYCELREGHLTSYNRVAASTVSYGYRPASLPLAILAALLAALVAQATT